MIKIFFSKEIFHYCLLTTSLLALTGAGQLHAQSIDLDPIYIESGKGKTSKDEFRRVEQTNPQVIVDRETFEDKPSGPRINDAIKHLPGVTVSGGIDEGKDLRIRGLDKEFTRVTIDGIQWPDSGEKRELQINRLPAFAVDSLELIRTPTPDIEHDGIAGRLNIKTREISKKWTNEFDAALGRLDGSGDFSGSIQALTGGRIGNFGMMMYGSLVEEAGSKHKLKYKKGELAEEERENKPVIYKNLGGDFAWYYNSGTWHLKPVLSFETEDKDKTKYKFKNGAFDGSELEDEIKDKETYGLTLTNEQRFTWGGVLESLVGYYDTSEIKDKTKRAFKKDGTEDLGKFTTEDEDKSDAFWQGKFSYTQAFDTDGNFKVKTGVDIRLREREKAKIKIEGGTLKPEGKANYKLDEDYYAPYVRTDLKFGNLTITAGGRYEYVERTSEDGNNNIANQTTGDLLPSISVSYKLSNSLYLRSGFAQTVNRPKFDQLSPFEDVDGSKVEIGNPDLTPSYADGFDAGFEYVTSGIFFGFNYFRRDITDLLEEKVDVTAAFNAANGTNFNEVLQTRNVGDGWTHGIELEQRIDFGLLGFNTLKGFVITANESFIDSEVHDEDTGITRRFKDQPSFIANLTLEYELPVWQTQFGISFSYVGALHQIKTGGDDKDALLVVDAQITQPITESVKLYATAQNLTGEDQNKYKPNGDHDYESSPRSFLVGLRAKF